MNKKLSSSLFIIIVVCGLIVTGVVRFGVVQASMEVSGIISSDTVWTNANSPYTLVGNLLVNKDVILTIQPGVVVNIGTRYLMVNGTLNARGDSVHPIIFNANPDHIGPPSIAGSIIFTQFISAWNEQAGSGCIIENAVVYALLTLDGTIKLDNDTFYDKITMETGTGTSIISNNIIKHGIDVGPWGGSRNDVSVVISNNTVMNEKIVVSFPSTGSINVSNNTCFWAILVAKFAYSSGTFVPIIENNLLVNNLVGIGILDSGAGKGPIIRNNTITNNTYGILISYSSPPHSHDLTCSNNNIYSNTEYNVKTQDPANINLANNWWGTTNSSAISESIYDYDNDFTLGAVNFVPFLNSPNLQAPAPTLTINASSGLGGSINPNGLVPVNYGSNQTFSVTANPGYQIVRVLMDGKPATAPYTFYNVTSVGHTISATFQLIPAIPDDGIISTNTTWTKTNSPYTLPRNILINNGVILTVEAGVTVNLNNYYIMVNGTLYARGNSTNRINFAGGQITFTEFSTDWNESTGAGCIIENAVINSTMTLNSSPKIRFNAINSLVDVEQTKGIPTIANNTLTGGISVSVNGMPLISNNTFLGLGISLSMTNSTVTGNTISGCNTGISALTVTWDNNNPNAWPNSTALIERNLIVGNTNGITITAYQGSKPGSPIVRNNTIMNNTNGISLSWQGLGAPNPAILNNNVFNNSRYNIVTAVPSDANAANNWWGTTNITAIEQTIYDYNDDFNLGKVNYSPILTAPNPQAPPVPLLIIVASAGAGGSVSPSGSISVSYGSSQTFNVTANPGYQIVNVTMDGTLVTAPYTFTNVVAGHTISATFQQVPAIPEDFPPWILFTLLTIVMFVGTAVLKGKNRN